jgi:hypothetical protein
VCSLRGAALRAPLDAETTARIVETLLATLANGINHRAAVASMLSEGARILELL